MKSIKQARLSSHAEMRLQQRGLSATVVQLVASYGDFEIPADDGRRWVRLSNSALSELAAEGESPTLLSQAERTFILIASDGAIITVLRIAPDRRPRGVRHRYRRR